jgi:hypothetical protein
MTSGSQEPRLKLVYCLSGDSGETVGLMTRLSVAVARHTNPEAVVSLVVDPVTHNALAAGRSRLLDEVDDTIVCTTSDGPAPLRSRHLKTSMRNIVDGAFLFVDSDTLIRKTLRPIWPAGCDVAASPNHSRDTFVEQLWADDARHLETMGWSSASVYLNSGVIFFADSPGARSVGRRWHDCWMQGLIRTGRHNDQPSFNHSVLASDAKLYVLPHSWNAQLHVSPRMACGATIWHYYHSATRPADTTFAQAVRDLTAKGPLPLAVVERLVAEDLPWPTHSWVTKLVVNRMLRRERPTLIESAILAGDYVRASKHVVGAIRDRVAACLAPPSR